VQLLYDETQASEADIMVGMLQMAAGRRALERGSGIIRQLMPTSPDSLATTQPDRMLVHVERKGVGDTGHGPIHAQHVFLAGLVPMFVLFGASNAARTLLEQISGGSIRRWLAAPIRPAHILLGQMLYGVCTSFTQCVVMYLFAWLVFDVEIWHIAGGLLLLTVATCMASAGFGMFIGSFCRTPEQLDAIGTVVILVMSAVGGSMVPRWVMPESMLPFGLLTINGWAYDGFIALIRNEGLRGIAVECLVLAGIAISAATAGSVMLRRRLRV
jgi:ABC-2 type transport system permease protein